MWPPWLRRRRAAHGPRCRALRGDASLPSGDKRAGRPRAPDTHQGALSVGKAWAAFCVKQRWLKANRFAEVEPVGAKTMGADKARLTVDETRKLQAYCHAHVEDLGAVATLTLLLLGMRSSELVNRNVRDLDDEGRLLWIGKTKTKAGRRRLRVPPELVPLLLAVAGGRPGDAPLFMGDQGRRWTLNTALRQVKRVCVAAGVLELPPQGLRRTQATLAEEAGETGLAVARHLGHATGAAPAVTHRSYVGRDTARNAEVERSLVVIRGGRAERWKHAWKQIAQVRSPWPIAPVNN